jgi:hypothetical protein
MKKPRKGTRFAICVDNGGYDDDLRLGTVYQILPDELAAKSHDLRVIDETGEDYIYPAAYFVFIQVPPEAEQVLLTRLSAP